MYLPLTAYLLVAVALAWMGRRTRLGSGKLFLMAILLTPLLPLAYLLVAPEEPRS